MAHSPLAAALTLVTAMFVAGGSGADVVGSLRGMNADRVKF